MPNEMLDDKPFVKEELTVAIVIPPDFELKDNILLLPKSSALMLAANLIIQSSLG